VNWISPSTSISTAARSAISLTVNGVARMCAGDPSTRLSDALRDTFGLTGTKVGCNAGDCGACTVHLNGTEACSCLVAIGQCEGASIVTVEGLAAGGKLTALQRAFHAHGAAQCGICTPGMLMAASGLLARNAQPTKLQVEDALGGVLCRCTGYQKIVEAILDVQTFAEEAAVVVHQGAAVGTSLTKVDGIAKITGAERFGDDGVPADALRVRVIRSPNARATFTIGDLAAFRQAHPGIVAVLTAADVPNNGFGVYPNIKDQPVLASGYARYRGDAILALVGTFEALAAIDERDLPIQYEQLPPIIGIDAAKTDGATQLHANRPGNILADGGVQRGDIDEAFGCAAHVVEVVNETSFVEHAYIEPEAGWAVRKGDTIDLHVSTQTPYQHRDEVALVMGLPSANIRLIPTACGGGFGGKLDLNVHAIVALAAWSTGKPVAYAYSRPESMMASTKRHPARVRVRAACDAKGRLTAFWSHAELDTGAYASWGPTVANRVPVHAAGPYMVPNAQTRGTAYFTNAPPSGAFRGFGVPQSAIASEAAMDELADRSGTDWLAFRRLNALRAGDTTITGQRLDGSVGIVATINAVEPHWKLWSGEAESFNRTTRHSKRGVGVACSWYGIGNTSLSNPSEMRVGIDAAGQVTLYSGAVDIGQGANTIMVQIAADALGVPTEAIRLVSGDTALTPDAGKTSASRQTFVSGKACQLAALDLRRQLFELVGAPLDLVEDASVRLQIEGNRVAIETLSSVYRSNLVELSGAGRFDPPTTPLDTDGQGSPYACYGFATQVALVEVDIELGLTRVLKIAAAHDVGRAINPQQVEGQIHGGTAQGIGLALMEEYIPGRTENLHDYLIPTVGDMPEMTAIIIEDPAPDGPFGAKGVGEPALISTAPAIFGGIFKACGVRVRKVPVLPHRLLAALREKGGGSGS
jgi:aldehyde oxidoreductase